MSIFYFILLWCTALAHTNAHDGSNTTVKERIQTLAFVIDDFGNSTVDLAKQASNCAESFLAKIAAGDFKIQESLAVNGVNSVAQTENLVVHSDEEGFGCSMVWSLSTLLNKPMKNERPKRSPQGLLSSLLTDLTGTVSGIGLRKRRDIPDETLRVKRSPQLGGLLGSLLGGGGGSGRNLGGDDEEGEDEGDRKRRNILDETLRVKRSPLLGGLLGGGGGGSGRNLGGDDEEGEDEGDRKRRNILDETLRVKRSPLLGGLIDGLLGGGGSEGSSGGESEGGEGAEGVDNAQLPP